MDWLEQVVEHRTPTGRINRVKVKSLPPKEQERYKPKNINEQVFNEIKKLKQNLSPQDKNEKKQTIMDAFGSRFKDEKETDSKSRYHIMYDEVKTHFNKKYNESSFNDKLTEAPPNKTPDLVEHELIRKGWQGNSTSPASMVVMSLVSSLKLSTSEQPIDDEDLITILGGQNNFEKLKTGVQQIYNKTQENFKKKSIKNIKIYRGQSREAYLINRPLQSWTIDKQSAKKFGNKIKSDTVDVSKIFFNIGNDLMNEKEMIKLTKENNNMKKIALFCRGEI